MVIRGQTGINRAFKSMKFICTTIPDVFIVEPQVFADERGWFMESFNERLFQQALVDQQQPLLKSFVQDNHSLSQKGVVRGLHFQRTPYGQGKLVRVIQGGIWDVAVDIRLDSATLGQSVGIELTATNHRMLWLPEGFAHGFLALEDNTQVLYKTTDYYHKEAEGSIAWNDPVLAIDWPVLSVNRIVSAKDSQAMSYTEYLAREHASA